MPRQNTVAAPRRSKPGSRRTRAKAAPARRRLPSLLLLLLLAATIALVLWHGGLGAGAGISLQIRSIPGAMLVVAVVVFIGGMLLTAFHGRLSQALEAAMLWVLVVVLILVGYTYRGELREIGDRVLAQLSPGHAVSRGRVVELARGHNGDFPVTTRVNGARVAMILDTGASTVMLTQEAARAAGLPLEVLD
jgi:aspartyl protease family protein